MPDRVFDVELLMNPEQRSLGKRKSARRGYIHRQLIADYDGCRIPVSRDFYWVTTRNLSTGGFSFISNRKPRTEYLVVALNAGRACFISRVVWAFCRIDLPEKPFEIGCEFVARLA